jgi:hypothetical protein
MAAARIRIAWAGGAVTGQLLDTPTTKKLVEVLPCTSSAQTWGDEVYFEVPMEATLEPDARQVVEPGTIGFWVEGNSLAIPFGPTPISRGNECRLAARVNILGKLEGDPKVLKSVKPGAKLEVSLMK